MGSQWGKCYSVTTFGESHGHSIGVVIDGVPAGLHIDVTAVQKQLMRRRTGQSDITSARNEKDQVEWLSGLKDGVTLGTPISAIVKNVDHKPEDYANIRDAFRPSHADFSTYAKYGISHGSGGGRSSARETVARVIAGAVAMQLLSKMFPQLRIMAWVNSVGNVTMPESIVENDIGTADRVEKSLVRCPDEASSRAMETLIHQAKEQGDSLGGTIKCSIKGLPAGIGDPVFDKLEAELAKAMLSLPASKGIEFGGGFAMCQKRGSEVNDAFFVLDGKISTKTNHSGGIQGGISNGAEIIFRTAFKPPSTIQKKQETIDIKGRSITLENIAGRHDPCVLPRAVVMVEAMSAIVIADHVLRQLPFEKSQNWIKGDS